MSKKTFSVIVPSPNGSYAVAVEADYFIVDENGFLGFSNAKDAGFVATFRNWVYVVTK